MTAPLVVNTKDGVCWTRRVVTSGGIALYAPETVKTCPAFVMATIDELAGHGIVGSADVLPMPVSPEPQAEERAKVAEMVGNVKPATDRLLEQLAGSVRDVREHEHPKWEDLYCLNLVSWMGERMGPVLRRLLDAEARVAELEAERHSTNESLSEAAEQLRVNRDRITELEARLAEREQPADTYPPALPWARLMDDDDLIEFLTELAGVMQDARHMTTLAGHVHARRILDGLEKTCGTWRLIAEAQHAHNTAPGPDADEPGMRHAARTEDAAPADVCRCGEPDADPYECEADDCTGEFSELNPFGGSTLPVEKRSADVSRICGCGWQTSVWHVNDGSAEEELHRHVVRVHGGAHPAKTGGAE